MSSPMASQMISPTSVAPRFAKNGFRYDSEVTAAMIEDMLFDPILAARVILDIEMPPHQELRLLLMWTRHFTMDDSGFSTGKSFTAAVVIALRSVLLQGRISGVLSGTFRQGKLIFQYLDKWAAKSRLFRSTLKHQGGKPRLVHGTEVWEAFFRGGSQVRVLPPNFVQDSTRLRSERWNDGYFDEWTTFGNFESLTKTIFGRCTAANDYSECPVRQNHVHCFSTPGYKHQPAYRLVEKIEARIKKGNTDYARYTSNYRHIPRTEQWKHIVDMKTIRLMQDTNPPGVIASEVDGIWQDESSTFYSSRITDPETRGDYTPVLSRVNSKDIYVAGFDVARGEQDSSRSAAGDDFSLHVIRVPEGEGTPYPCFCRRYTGIKADQMSALVHAAHLEFQLSAIVYDPGGGGLFVRDELAKPVQEIAGVETKVFPLLEFGDNTGTLGDQIITPFRRSATFIKSMWGMMQSDSVSVNRLHSLVRNRIYNNTVLLPPIWEDTRGEIDDKNANEVRELLNKSTMPDIERCRAELHLMVLQLALVDVQRSKEDGKPYIDSHGMYKFLSKAKKDSAYGFCYAVLALEVWKTMLKFGWKGNARKVGTTRFAASLQSF